MSEPEQTPTVLVQVLEKAPALYLEHNEGQEHVVHLDQDSTSDRVVVTLLGTNYEPRETKTFALVEVG